MMPRALSAFLVAALLLCLLAVPGPASEGDAPELTGEAALSISDIIPASSGGAFTRNLGQVGDGGILFYEPSGRAAFMEGSVMLYSSGQDSRVAVRLSFVGANSIVPVGLDRAPWTSSYFLGNDSSAWFTDIPNFRAIAYPNLWDGIDLVYRTVPNGLKYDFIVHPGADPGRIVVSPEGHQRLSIGEDGSLVMATAFGQIVDSGLNVFYADAPEEQLEARFSLLDNGAYAFTVHGRDPSRTLVIDPLVYSTFIGGTGSDSANAVAVDSLGNAYVTGSTDSVKFSTTAGAVLGNADADSDVFVAKFSSDGTDMHYMAFIGGSEYESGLAIAVDAEGSAYVAGETFSPAFPLSDNAIQRAYGGVGDAFVVKLGPSGSSLVYSTYLGGRHDDIAYGIAVDDRGQAHVCGRTWSSAFPVTQGSLGPVHNGDADAFVAKIADTGDYLVYSTFLGGTGSEHATSIALGPEGVAHVAGVTSSFDFPVTGGAINITGSGNSMFTSGLTRSGNALTHSAVFGGSGADMATGIAIDGEGLIHIAGTTSSGDFPVTEGAYSGQLAGGMDAVVCKLNASANLFIYSSYLGGRHDDMASGISVGPSGQAMVIGRTASGDYPVTSGGRAPSGGTDAFITLMNESGARPAFSSCLGGSGDDMGLGVSLTLTECALVAGRTVSANFPVTLGVPIPTPGGGTDAFLAKLDITAPVARPGPDILVNESNFVTFNGTASSDNEAIGNYTWQFNDGIRDLTLHGETATHLFTVPGDYGVVLTVTDGVGNSDTASLNVSVLMYPYPIARAGTDIEALQDVPVQFDGTASTDNTGIVFYAWEFPDGVNNASMAGPSPTWLFGIPGIYPVSLTVMDRDGNMHTDFMNVTILDASPPLADPGPPITVEIGMPAILDGSGSWDAVGVANYTWTFTHNGTEIALHGPEQAFTFWEPGEHAVTLTATDEAGNSASNIVLVTVTDTHGGISTRNALGALALALSALFLCAAMIRDRKRKREGGGHD